MNEPEAIGEAVSGGILARAIEPKAGEVGADGHTRESSCLNCATPLEGDFCFACGQRAHVHRTLTGFAHDLLHGVLHLDGKVWRTLPMLASRPGELTRRYIDGERAKFVSPLALFLFSVFLMFAVVGQNVDLDQLEVKTDIAEAGVEQSRTLRELEARRKRAADAGQSTAALDAQIANARENVEALERVRQVPGTIATFEVSRNLQWLRTPIERRPQPRPAFLQDPHKRL